jgi:cytochrome P450
MVEAHPDQVKPTLFTKLLRAEAEDSLPFNEIRDEAQGYIVAGTDTTANTLTFLVWAVCKHPEVRMALVEELQTKLGPPPTQEGKPWYTDDQLRALPYLNQVIEETLRMFASVPGLLPRTVPPEGSELAGYWFEGGTVVSAQAYTLHRDPVIFPDPERFDPSRWAMPTKDMKDAFFAWGGGARGK